MKLPLSPPNLLAVFNDDKSVSPQALRQTVNKLMNGNIGPCDSKGRYLHWNKIRHLSPPEGYDPILYWLAIKQARKAISKTLPFQDKHAKPFVYAITDTVMRDVLWISENSTGAIASDVNISDAKDKQHYLINSLIEEVISSSQLEGASTTRYVAKEMLRNNTPPKDNSERMIRNNYHAMKFVRDYKQEDLTPSMIFELHKILTEETLSEKDKNKGGLFREEQDAIAVYSNDDVLLHQPPHAKELKGRLQALCDFANEKENAESYIPPIIKAIILHFMLAYDHPFVDGNGRTARVLFYWYMAKTNYWLLEYISISRIIKQAPAQYMHAYLHTETDDNDMTYFIVHQLEVIKAAIVALGEFFAKKSTQLRDTEQALKHSSLQGKLNHRQLGVLRRALENPGAEYSIKSHQNSHAVTYQTARTDLLKLSDEYGILNKYKVGKKDIFIAPANLRERILYLK